MAEINTTFVLKLENAPKLDLRNTMGYGSIRCMWDIVEEIMKLVGCSSRVIHPARVLPCPVREQHADPYGCRVRSTSVGQQSLRSSCTFIGCGPVADNGFWNGKKWVEIPNEGGCNRLRWWEGFSGKNGIFCRVELEYCLGMCSEFPTVSL